MGLWLTRDPLQERGGRNLYSFCKNSSLNVIDIHGGLPVPTWPSYGDGGRFHPGWNTQSAPIGVMTEKMSASMLDYNIYAKDGEQNYLIGTLDVTIGVDNSRKSSYTPFNEKEQWQQNLLGNDANLNEYLGVYMLLRVIDKNEEEIRGYCCCHDKDDTRLAWQQKKYKMLGGWSYDHENGQLFYSAKEYLEDYTGAKKPSNNDYLNAESILSCRCNGKKIAKFYWAARWFNGAGAVFWWPSVIPGS